jgi:Na+-translocating ferredoxin:NAD+ oxidoreductase RnfG subunit
MTHRLRLILLAAVLLSWAVPNDLKGQNIDGVSESLLREVMPEADLFSPATGDPLVKQAYQGQELIGYVFITSDLPPEEYGYSGTIETLVGMRLDGTITGIRVTDYRESYMRSMGDFLRRPGFQEQYTGKYVGEAFRVGGDVDGISQVSISVRALSRGIRNTARRVANAYSFEVELPTGTVEDVVGLSWFELRRRGIVERLEVTEPGEGSAGISLAHMWSDRVGEYLLGEEMYQRALASVERRGGADHLMLYTVDGPRLRLFVREGWAIEQGGDTVDISPDNIVMLGLTSGGVSYGEATITGVMMVEDTVDITRPFTFLYDLGSRLGSHRLDYTTQEARIIMAEEAAAAAEAEAAAERAAAEERAAEEALANSAPPSTTVEGVAPIDTAEAELGGASYSSAIAGSEEVLPNEGFDFTLIQEETLLERMLANTSWDRVALILIVLAFGMAAFFTKITLLRWVSLGVTLLVLGFVDGGFLSVSHITSAIWVGPSVFLDDLPLLLMVVFTVVTTLIWGRVFCGFLCPFGALQDFLDRIIPESWKRTPSIRAHRMGLWAKYLVLAIIVIPALAGSHVSFYEYFEPFGTVFFRSPSILLWVIAGGFILASAIVPRFYCRYACPLGAALAIASVVSPKRIRRVEQCDHCLVCQQKCPTGAIEGPEIDFKECVRCNVCEVQLIEKAGVCRHEMEEIRPRLIQVKLGLPEGVADGA